MRTVDLHECRALAELSRLALTDDEAGRFSEQLGAILGYIEQLQAVDVEGVPEFLTQATDDSALRPDTPSAPLDVEVALSQAPARRGRLVVVPRIMDGGEG